LKIKWDEPVYCDDKSTTLLIIPFNMVKQNTSRWTDMFSNKILTPAWQQKLVLLATQLLKEKYPGWQWRMPIHQLERVWEIKIN
jgi:hypothetical protein